MEELVPIVAMLAEKITKKKAVLQLMNSQDNLWMS